MDDIFDTDVEDIPKGAHRFDPTPEEMVVGKNPVPSLIPAAERVSGLIWPWMNETPPARQWLIDGLVPCGQYGFLSAAGGTGKSMLVNQLAVAVATGISWLDRPVAETGAVLILNSEDDESEMHRRFHNVAAGLKSAGEIIDPSRVPRIHPLSVRGQDWRLLENVGSNLTRHEGRIQRIIEVAQWMDAKLIILDPLASFYGGDENDNGHAQAFVEAMRHIVEETQATVLCVHHSNKSGLATASTEQGSHRGASAFIDGARFSFALATMSAAQANTYGIKEEERRGYARLDANKANYSSPWSGCWLTRGYGGFLSTIDLQLAEKPKKSDSTELHEAILEQVRSDAEQGKYHSKTGFPNAFQGTEAMLGNGQYSIRGALDQLLESGDLVEDPPPFGIRGKPKVLLLPVG